MFQDRTWMVPFVLGLAVMLRQVDLLGASEAQDCKEYTFHLIVYVAESQVLCEHHLASLEG